MKMWFLTLAIFLVLSVKSKTRVSSKWHGGICFLQTNYYPITGKGWGAKRAIFYRPNLSLNLKRDLISPNFLEAYIGLGHFRYRDEDWQGNDYSWRESYLNVNMNWGNYFFNAGAFRIAVFAGVGMSYTRLRSIEDFSSPTKIASAIIKQKFLQSGFRFEARLSKKLSLLLSSSGYFGTSNLKSGSKFRHTVDQYIRPIERLGLVFSL